MRDRDDIRSEGRTAPTRGLAALLGVAAVLGLSLVGGRALSQRPEEAGKKGGFPKKDVGERALAEPFKGISTKGEVVRGLFPIRSTGVSTAPVREAAEAFLASLTPEQRGKTMFPVDDPEWRKWMNVHMYPRQGVSLRQVTEPQREAAFALLKASLSAKGLKISRDIMKLNHTLGELMGDNFREYGEDLYFFTVMGQPSDSEPWGWQIDGHHLIVNYFVLGDQVVMTPTFLGSEPVRADAGKYKGTVVLQVEQDKGLALINALDEPRRKKAILSPEKGGNGTLAGAFMDNLVLDFAGIKGAELTDAQKAQLLDLAGEYVRNMDDGHAKIEMDDVRAHLDETYFAWIGQTGPESVFYYRIQSPVILIEFDHQSPGPLGMRNGGGPGGRPTRQHIHAVVRTPNGNDYGKDLLRQHYEKHPHPHDR